MRDLHVRGASVAAVVVAVGLAVLPSSTAAAQVWVNARGELSVALRSDYQTSRGVWHGSTLVTGLPVQALNNSLSVEYVPIDRLALGLTLSGNGVRYTGPQSIPGSAGTILAHGSQDDGAFHWSVTDLEAEAHYQLYDHAITVSPVIRCRVPVADYEQKGYAATGPHLKEVGAGFALGRDGLGLADLVLQLDYTFTFVEKESGGGDATARYRVNRSDADLFLLYMITGRLSAGAGAAFRFTHDGFDLTDYPDLPPGDPLIMWHDPVLRARYLSPTLVAGYQLSHDWSLSARFTAVVWGENVSNPLSFGVTLGWANNLAD